LDPNVVVNDNAAVNRVPNLYPILRDGKSF
jgi:hypothetical protein